MAVIFAWIKPENLNISMYVYDSDEYLSIEGAEVTRLLPKGSVLVSCIGNIRKTAIAGRELAINQQINSLIPREILILNFYITLVGLKLLAVNFH